MVKITELFDAYDILMANTPNAADAFSNSRMKNISRKLDFGFFPLGSGILVNGKSETDKAEIEERGVMILGHDFGTEGYVLKDCPNNRESNSKTINNLEKLGLNTNSTFFTNFYLGLRDNELYPKMTMTHYDGTRGKEYKELCMNFFLTQLAIIDPEVVVCLGKEVRLVLYELFEEIFPELKNKGISYAKLFENGKHEINTNGTILGERKFTFVPHPSFAHINWSNGIKEKILKSLA